VRTLEETEERNMPNEPQFHAVYKSINKPLTIWGVEVVHPCECRCCR